MYLKTLSTHFFFKLKKIDSKFKPSLIKKNIYIEGEEYKCLENLAYFSFTSVLFKN